MKKSIAYILSLLLAGQMFLLTSCGADNKSGDGASESTSRTVSENETDQTKDDTGMNTEDEEQTDTAPAGFTFEAVHYTDTVVENGKISKWEKENDLANDACEQDGIVVSPYFTMKVNGVEVPVYASRTTRGAHSFAYIDISNIDENGKFELDLEITTDEERTNPIVLPESAGVKAEINGTKAAATITEFGSFTFTFDRGSGGKDGSEHPLTVMVKEKEELAVPEDYKVKELEPGEYPAEKTMFTDSNTVYYFKAGRYTFDSIQIGSDCILYFESGALLIPKPITADSDGIPTTSTIFYCYNRKNVQIIGRPAVDISYCYEGKSTMYTFEKVDNLTVSGMTSINSCGWTFCLTNCTNVNIRDLLILAYRTFSDGVLLSDCRDVNVTGCFVRTGDDGMEVKSTSDGSVRTGNVLFENNAVWTDKGIGYGAVYESNFDQSDVTFRNNSVGYALANWSRHLGCTTISIRGNNPEIQDFDMHFENIEIYCTYCPVTTLVLHEGGYVHDIYFNNITAKYIDLGENIFEFPIDMIILNDDGGSLTDFAIENIYFDNIDIAGTKLTPDNAETLIRANFAKNLVTSFSWDTIRINYISP